MLCAGGDLVRRRRGLGGAEKSKINGLNEGKVTYDIYGSSSGYSSEDDSAGRQHFLPTGTPSPGRCPVYFEGCPIQGGWGEHRFQIKG